MSGPVHQMATHAAQLIIDDGLVTPRRADARPRKRKSRDRAENAHELLLGRSHDARGRAMVGNIGLGVSGAPVVVIGLAGLKQGRVAFVAVAEASAAGALAAAVIIGNDIVLAVARIVTGPDPGDR